MPTLDTLRALLADVPFRRFQVRLTDGTVWTVLDPDDVAISDDGREIQGFVEAHDLADVAAIEPAGGDDPVRPPTRDEQRNPVWVWDDDDPADYDDEKGGAP
jgi:hypothetical protein